MLRKSSMLGSALACAVLFGCASTPSTRPASTLRPFASEEALAADLKKMADEVQRRRDEEERRRQEALRARAEAELKRAEALSRERAEKGLPPLAAAPAPKPAPKPEAKPKPASVATAARGTDSVTNVQHAGVDEGGIVKVHGNHLVILRRGRLFTVRIGDRDLTPVSAAAAYADDVNPRGTWYDEMLISGNTIVVIGYSYARGGTEIGLFDISAGGEVAYRSTYHLRSNDYYSSRNYSSRLIGTKLIFYAPLRLNVTDPYSTFPAVRRWRPDAKPADFRRIAPATSIYRTDEDLDPWFGVALHTVTICDVAKAELDCRSTAVLGPPGRVFYVSPRSVYVWTAARVAMTGQSAVRSAVFQIPLDGSPPSSLKTAGTPVDQFSFLEEAGYLHVLLRAAGGGEGMWAAEKTPGQLGLMRVTLTSFSDGSASAPRTAYRALPTPPPGTLQSRYIGEHLVYGTGTGWYRPTTRVESAVYATRYADSAAADERLALPHGVDRVEALGKNAVVIGSDGKDLHFTSVRLGARAEEAARYTRADAAQAETRSHGFYYHEQSDGEGLVGLPIAGGGVAAARQLRSTAASVLYLRNDALKLSELGTLDGQSDAARVSDGCVASCVDWYGNSRPLFLRGRVFALLGYEIVEGSVSGSRIAEVRRINFAPHWTSQVR